MNILSLTYKHHHSGMKIPLSQFRSPVLLICFVLNASFVSMLYGQYQLDTLFVEKENIGVEQGLSAGYVYDIAQDKNGFIWFATMQGLNRWDGYEMKEYINDANDPNSLPNNRVRAIHFDSDGLLCLVHAEGLSVFDPVQEQFITPEISTGFKSLHSKDDILAGHNEDVYFNIHPTNWTILKKESIEGDLEIEAHEIEYYYQGLPSDLIKSSIALTNDQKLYFTHQDTLYGYSLDTADSSAARCFTLPIEPYEVYNRNYLKVHPETGHLWYFGPSSYLEIENNNNGSIVEYEYPKAIQNSEKVPIKTLSNGRFLLSNSGQLSIIDPLNKRFSVLADLESDNTILSGRNSDKCYLLDDQDILWVATAGSGVDKFDLNESKFKSLPNPTHSIFEVQLLLNNIVSVNQGGHLYNFKNTRELPPFQENVRKNEITIQEWSGALSDHKDLTVVINRYLKVFPPEAVFWTFDRDLNPLRGWSHPDLIEMGKKHTGIRYFLFHDNSLGVVSFYSGKPNTIKVLKWDYSKTDTTTVYIYPNVENENLSGEINKPYITRDGLLWITTNQAGLFCLDPKADKWTRIKKETAGHSGLRSNQVLSVVEDQSYPDSILWIGTSAGLHHYNRIDGTYEVYDKQHGLPNQVIYSVLQDDEDRLWLSTNNGLCRFDYVTKEVRNFTTEDGLTHNEFNKNCAVQDSNGMMYFGGIKGVNYFNPNDFDQDSVNIPVSITSLKVNDKTITPNTVYKDKSLNGLLSKPIIYTEEIILNYKHKMVAFEFALLDYTNSEENQFAYKLEGFNDDWIDAKTTNQATYTNLPKGSYTFKVKAKTHEDIWNRDIASIKLTILPPLWDRWWFKLGIFLIIISGIYALFNNRLQQDKKLEALRNRISKDLHDEIGSTLSSISLFGTVAQKMAKQDQETTINMLERINDSTTQVMESMNDIVWAINSENDKINDLLMRMRAYVSEVSDTSETKVHLNIDDSIKNYTLDMVQKRNIYLIFKEAVNNAFKYAKASQIEIQFNEENKAIFLYIEDDGIGFNLDDVSIDFSLGGNGLGNMKNRAKEMNGKIDIVSKIGKGTRIIFQWDLNNLTRKK